jgi:hypothetical protein
MARIRIFSSTAIYLWAASFVAIGVVLVQHIAFPSRTEEIARSTARILGLLVVPILTATAAKSWYRLDRTGIFRWRTITGVVSLALTSAAWIPFAYGNILQIVRPGSTVFDLGLHWSATLSFCSLTAALLAGTLAGVARPQAAAAGVLLWAAVQSGVYF